MNHSIPNAHLITPLLFSLLCSACTFRGVVVAPIENGDSTLSKYVASDYNWGKGKEWLASNAIRLLKEQPGDDPRTVATRVGFTCAPHPSTQCVHLTTVKYAYVVGQSDANTDWSWSKIEIVLPDFRAIETLRVEITKSPLKQNTKK